MPYDKIIYATWNLIRNGQDCWSSYECLISTNIYNLWDQYFWWFLENIKYYTFDKAMTIQVQDWIFMVITLIIFLSFVVGFIFVSRK